MSGFVWGLGQVSCPARGREGKREREIERETGRERGRD